MPTGTGTGIDFRTQREIVRDVLLAADDVGNWHTLRELAEMTKFAEGSIAAQMRHLRHEGYELLKKHREKEMKNSWPTIRHAHPVWEYRLRKSE